MQGFTQRVHGAVWATRSIGLWDPRAHREALDDFSVPSVPPLREPCEKLVLASTPARETHEQCCLKLAVNVNAAHAHAHFDVLVAFGIPKHDPAAPPGAVFPVQIALHVA